MPASLIHQTLKDHTEKVVATDAFAQVAKACPYFEQWWTVELARALSGSGTKSLHRFIAFEPPSISRTKASWYPDLVLATPETDHIAWVELKQVNLLRQMGDLADPVSKAMRTKLIRGLTNI